MEFNQSHLMLLAGFILLGWVLARRTILQRRRVASENKQSHRALDKLRDFKQPAAPFCDAPVETQRWQVALFDLQRELKADLDTRIAVVQSLIREADQRIESLSQLESAIGQRATEQTAAVPRAETGGNRATFHDADEAPTAASETHTAAGEAPRASAGDDLGAGAGTSAESGTSARHPRFSQIATLADSGHTEVEIAERLGQPLDEVQRVLATLSDS